jgi:hypothetical protein
MGQRVNISYSVELDELDIEVQRLLKSALVEIQYVVGECNMIEQSAPLTVSNCALIDKIRQKMAKADIIFNDTTNIINGYLNYKSTSQPQHTKLDDATDDADFNELKEKIQNFKHSVSDE